MENSFTLNIWYIPGRTQPPINSIACPMIQLHSFIGQTSGNLLMVFQCSCYYKRFGDLPSWICRWAPWHRRGSQSFVPLHSASSVVQNDPALFSSGGSQVGWKQFRKYSNIRLVGSMASDTLSTTYLHFLDYAFFQCVPHALLTLTCFLCTKMDYPLRGSPVPGSLSGMPMDMMNGHPGAAFPNYRNPRASPPASAMSGDWMELSASKTIVEEWMEKGRGQADGLYGKQISSDGSATGVERTSSGNMGPGRDR